MLLFLLDWWQVHSPSNSLWIDLVALPQYPLKHLPVHCTLFFLVTVTFYALERLVSVSLLLLLVVTLLLTMVLLLMAVLVSLAFLVALFAVLFRCRGMTRLNGLASPRLSAVPRIQLYLYQQLGWMPYLLQ
ncbi:hypothetical protein TcCL_Unassigned05355 [Trypanosoma cruzi]|nr:hypothetical protein TcCL_Unassigned05355 [Trypanosoma cruzi]